MNWDKQTIQTYDDSAQALAEYFKGVGARTEDIERALALAQAGTKASAVEIGCGDGRDAAEIVKRVAAYEGFDPSEGLLTLARQRLPGTSFVKADALSYAYPANLDVIYAFASLLHVSRDDMPAALKRANAALRPGGIMYLTLKARASYQAEAKEDQFGRRMFYYYTPETIKSLAGDAFEAAYERPYVFGHTQWFALALRKK